MPFFHARTACLKDGGHDGISDMSTHALAMDPRYPIGKYHYEGPFNEAQRQQHIETIAALPVKIKEAVAGLNDKQLDTPYRDGGWTVRQTVHHVADSHMNSFIRFRLGLTEQNPTIKPYEEALWADIADAKEPVQVSLTLLETLHRRMDVMLRSFKAEDWRRTVVHPENGKMTLDKMLGLYAWHSQHHVAHITELRKRMGW
jgi:uncharacterized damage-inducible protein DinB